VDYSAGSSAGIRAWGNGNVIKGNTVYNVGREGIKIASSSNTKVLYNVIHDAMLQTTDGGGIYTFGTNGSGSEFAYNRVYNVKSGGYGAVGIFLDNNSTNYLVHHNVVWNTNHALKMNYASKNNKIYNNTLAGTTYSVDTASNPNFSGSVFKNNIFTKPLRSTGGASFSNNIGAGTDAKFVNPSGANFQLKAGSPAINRGASISNITTGYTGGAPDIGALEYGRAAFGGGRPDQRVVLDPGLRRRGNADPGPRPDARPHADAHPQAARDRRRQDRPGHRRRQRHAAG
jgi:parallel beta-helix repeat protein